MKVNEPFVSLNIIDRNSENVFWLLFLYMFHQFMLDGKHFIILKIPLFFILKFLNINSIWMCYTLVAALWRSPRERMHNISLQILNKVYLLLLLVGWILDVEVSNWHRWRYQHIYCICASLDSRVIAL